MEAGVEKTVAAIEADGGPPLVRAIHPEDEMHLFLARHPSTRDTAEPAYYRSGAKMLWALQDMLRELGIELAGVGRFLEFACGYGRFTRHLVRVVDPSRVVGSDLYHDAVDFQRATFGVDGFYSTIDPDDLEIPGTFDVIFVASLFSHLPEDLFRRWLDKLYGALAPGGVLVFSTHGPVCLEPKRVIPPSGLLYHPQSESRTHSDEHYGSTYVTPAYVHAAVAALTGQPVELERPRGLFEFQDVYVVRRPGGVLAPAAHVRPVPPKDTGFDTAWLHVGLPGTAAALNDALATLSSEGRLRRVAYPLGDAKAEDQVWAAGNGAPLADLFRRRDPPKPQANVVENQLQTVLATQRVDAGALLFASEDFFFVPRGRLAMVRDGLARRARSVRVVAVVRPLRDWLFALHADQMRTQGTPRPFDAACMAELAQPILDGLAAIESIAGDDAVVLPYEPGATLVARFLAAIGEDPALAAHAPSAARTRALSTPELALLRDINTHFEDANLARAVAAAFVERWPEAAPAAFPADADAAYAEFAARFAPQFEAIAGPFLERMRPFLFGAPAAPAAAADEAADAAHERIAIAFGHVLKRGARLTRDVAVFENIRNYSRKLARTSEQFDPIHYLFMHPDLALRAIDPVKHYDKHGRREGRPSAFVAPSGD
jgi:SAM-dependent methyltransferase